MEDTDVVALENARISIQYFIREHHHVLEPCIGDLAAKAIIESTLRLGTPGKSLYSAFFVSSHSGKPWVTCYECAHADAGFSRN